MRVSKDVVAQITSDGDEISTEIIMNCIHIRRGRGKIATLVGKVDIENTKCEEDLGSKRAYNKKRGVPRKTCNDRIIAEG